ncbi:hypothetical protein OG21DRAFT_1406604, partial [Imleria badia]
VVLLNAGPSAGKIAVIAEITDHNQASSPRAIIDGPTTSVPNRHLSLTALRLTKLSCVGGTGVIRKQLEKEGTVARWENSAWSKKRAAIQTRRLLNDFARFEVVLAKKARRAQVTGKVGQGMSAALFTYPWMRFLDRACRPLCSTRVPCTAHVQARARQNKDGRPPSVRQLAPPSCVLFRRPRHQRSRNRHRRRFAMQSLSRRRRL